MFYLVPISLDPRYGITSCWYGGILEEVEVNVGVGVGVTVAFNMV